MRRVLLLPAVMFVFACSAEDAAPEDGDQADQGQSLKTTCSAGRLITNGPDDATTEPIELEVLTQDKGNEFERTVFRIKDQEKFEYALSASIEVANPEFVLVIFNDLNTDTGSAAEGRFGSELGAKAGLRFDWNISQIKDGNQEFVSMSCCQNATGECDVNGQ